MGTIVEVSKVLREGKGGGAYYSWIGFHDRNTEDEWEFVDGETDYCAPKTACGMDCDDIPEWLPCQPSANRADADCACITHGKRLAETPCRFEKPFICEFDSDAIVIEKATSATYIGIKDRVSWDTASSRCEKFGGQLATFSDVDEYATMVSVSKGLLPSGEAGEGYPWIGFHDSNTEDGWEFVDGATDYCSPKTNDGIDCDDIDQWGPGQPGANRDDADCAVITHGRVLAEIPCQFDRPYICEFKPGAMVIMEHANTYGFLSELLELSMKDVMLVIMAALNCVALAVILRKTKGARHVNYAKVMVDTDYEDQPLAA